MADILSQEEIDKLLSVAEGTEDDYSHRTRKLVPTTITYSMFKSDATLIKSMSLDDMKLAIACLWNDVGVEKSRTPVALLKYCTDCEFESDKYVDCCPRCKSEDVELMTPEAMHCNSCGKNY